jgi:uncharacterized membrane protein
MDNSTQKESKAEFIKILYWILALLPMIVTLFILPSAPDTVPAHYGPNSTVDRWSSKYELLVVPAITLAISLGGWIYAHRYRSKEHAEMEGGKRMPSDRKTLLTGMLVAILLLNAMCYIFLYTSCNKIQSLTGNNISRIFALVLNLFFVVFGNIMPKLKQNHFAGIRVKWTLENEDVWYLTHRFGGKLWVIGGIALTIVCLIVPSDFAMPISIVGLLIMTVAVCVYARNQYERITNEQNKK